MPHFDLPELIRVFGYIGLFAIVFAESGLFFGFFLPGDSLLFTAGFIASQHLLNILVLLLLLPIAAIIGDSVGYWMGNKFGSYLLKKKDNFFFKKHYIYEAQAFYEKHGGKAIVMARFVPVIRTFAPIVAGMVGMHYIRFIKFNVIGGLLWSVGLTLLGFYLGSAIPDVDRYLLPIMGIIIVLSILPVIFQFKSKNQPQASILSKAKLHIQHLIKKRITF